MNLFLKSVWITPAASAALEFFSIVQALLSSGPEVKKVAKIIKYLVDKGIPVMGHVGLLPQYSSNFKLQGKVFGDMTAEEKENVVSQFRGRKKVSKQTGEEIK